MLGRPADDRREGYRPELVDGTIYGVPSLIWRGAKEHDHFVAIKRGKAP